MLFIDNFSDNFSIVASAVAFVFLFAATFYVRSLEVGKGLMLLFGGLSTVFLISGLQVYAGYFYSHAVSAKILAFSELLLVLGGSVLLIMASSQILIQKPLSISIVFGFISIGLLVSAYAVFIADNADLVKNLSQILPMIGMSYVFLSFVSRQRILRRRGYLLAGFACVGFIILMTCSMLYGLGCPWYLSLGLLICLAFSYFLLYIDKLKAQMAALRDNQQKTARNIESIIKSSPFPIFISRLGDDTLLMANHNAMKLFGLAEDELSRYHFKDFFVDAENRRLLAEKLEKYKEVHNFEILVRTAGGNTPFWLLASVNIIDYNNDVVLYSAFQDITTRKRRESFLQNQADRDPLTSIFNRRYFENKVVEKISRSHEKREPFAILMIDADNFKKINDSYGHKIGDKVLIELASVCERTLRVDDLAARYGGEEFVVFLSNVPAATAVIVANRLKEAISNVIVYSDFGEPVRFTVSIGVAPSGISDDVNIMIKMADDAMYLAKQNGRNRVELFNHENLASLENEKERRQDLARQVHPVFSNEDNCEISLLDGIEANHIHED